jgi:hypothetical protein
LPERAIGGNPSGGELFVKPNNPSVKYLSAIELCSLENIYPIPLIWESVENPFIKGVPI